jgi:lipoprotein
MQKGKLLVGMFLVLLMAGCSATGTSKNDEGTKETVKTSTVSTSEENSVNKGEKVSTFVWGKDKDEATITYTYDESNDIVTKFKIESPQYARGIKDKEEGNKMIKILEGTKGVKASVIERNGTFIAVIEVDLKICKFSDMKKSDNYIIKGLAETGFLKGDGDEANYTQSKNNIIMNGFEER